MTGLHKRLEAEGCGGIDAGVLEGLKLISGVLETDVFRG